ncbi:hypothetical protein [Chryseobacterium sp. T16E-39]|uniref:hypothetical protein n=1 Tax=Chryseobacterium sp. T16E-39 TaxID=2015076 RepID=UPI0012FB83AB|nr:hypothetical protein [Chryseobacterium sp. T16E-39]
MNKKIILFSFVLFFFALCTSLFVFKGEVQSYSAAVSKNKLSQKYDHQNPEQGYTLSDNMDEPDLDDVEKVKFDYTVPVQQCLQFFFESYYYQAPQIAALHPVVTTTPRYILYHSLQINFC